jgi:polyisoprenoid-binding protein YceI
MSLSLRAIRSLFVLVPALAFAAPAAAQAQHTFTFAPESKIVIEGSSNVHAWTCATSTFTAAAESPDLPAPETGSKLTSLSLSIPVESLDCGHGDMNSNLRKAMHADAHPDIAVRLTSYEATRQGDSYDVTLTGDLTINGVAKPIVVRASVTPNGTGGASIVGSAPVTTTDFGVQPVRVMLGALRTSANVTITFRLTAIRQ